MDLDLERFWKMVRPNRRKPAPKPVTTKGDPIVFIEAIDQDHEACTRKVQFPLKTNENGDYVAEVTFPEFTREVTIAGFRVYPRENSTSHFVSCDLHRLRAGDSLSAHLCIRNPELKSVIAERSMSIDWSTRSGLKEVT
jgi:hypothetical protein